MPHYPPNKLRRRTETKKKEEQGDIVFLNKTPQHLRHRLKKKTVKFYRDLLKEIPYIKTEVPFTSRDDEEKTIDHLIKNLPADSYIYHIEHGKGTNTFKILEDPKQKEKDRIFEIIFNTEKKLDRLNSKAKIADLKCI